MSACGLCGDHARLCGSHIVPAFVARWIKDTSATGFLRSFDQPNRRVQDFKTRRLLCEPCEQRLCSAENEFARLLFHPFHAGRSRFLYDRWLLYFAVSLAWRCSVTSSRTELEKYPQHIEQIEAARARWRAFLLGESDQVGRYRFNLFFTPLGVTSESTLPEGLSWYLLRAPDATPVYSQVRSAIYVKLPGMFFWTSIVPPDPGGWKGTKIGRHGTLRAKNQMIQERAVGDFLFNRVETVYRRLTDISPRQKQRVSQTIFGNPERAADSLTIEALLDDERIRGENLLKR